MFFLSRRRVGDSVDFNSQLFPRAVEIHNVLFDSLLPSEFVAKKLLSFQHRPEFFLCIRRGVPQMLPESLLSLAVEHFLHSLPHELTIPLLLKKGAGVVGTTMLKPQATFSSLR